MLKEDQVFAQAIQALKECLLSIPSFEILSLEKRPNDTSADLLIKVRTKSVQQFIWVEVKSQGTPKNIRNAVNSLSILLLSDPASYAVVIAPYISPQSAEICDSANIGYVDLSGNCKIAFQDVFISRTNFPNKYPFKSAIASLYTPKSERILRVLLTYPFRPWKTLELANEAQVSPGMITHVRKKLDAEEWIQTSSEGFFLAKPENLLANWKTEYTFRKNTVLDYYSMKPVSDVEREIADQCDALGIRYALTGFSASSRLAPTVRNQRAMVYVDQDVSHLVERLEIKPVDSGANLFLLIPYDEGVFWNTCKINGIDVATPIQVYLDLGKYRGRGEEAATSLFNEVIQKSWQQQKPITTNFT